MLHFCQSTEVRLLSSGLVINGDEFTGVTTMRMDEGVDTGDMIAKSTVRLAPDETGGSCLISSQQREQSCVWRP